MEPNKVALADNSEMATLSRNLKIYGVRWLLIRRQRKLSADTSCIHETAPNATKKKKQEGLHVGGVFMM